MLGVSSSRLLTQKLVPLSRRRFLSLFRDFLSIGSIHYYLNDENWRTRLFIHNYFPLLTGSSFRAQWQVDLYTRTGSFVRRIKGEFTDSETAIVELDGIKGLDSFGIINAHIKIRSSEYFLPDTYGSVFFAEYYIPGTNKSIIAHSFSGSLKASHYQYRCIGTSFMTPPGFRPLLFVGSACRFQRFAHPKCGIGTVIFINHKKEKRIICLEKFRGRSCQRIDLFSIAPDLFEHFDHKPYCIEVKGKNILNKPFLFQTDGHYTLAEHL